MASIILPLRHDDRRIHVFSLATSVEMRLNPRKIMLTFAFHLHQEPLMLLDQAQQRPVKEGSKCVMHNGTSNFPFLLPCIFLPLVKSHPPSHPSVLMYNTAPIANGLKITSRL